MLVVMTSYLSLWVTDPMFQVIEFFAGAGRICRLARSLGLSACAHDIAYDNDNSTNSAFNIVRSAGYVFLALFLFPVLSAYFQSLVPSFSLLLSFPVVSIYSLLLSFFPILIPHLRSEVGYL